MHPRVRGVRVLDGWGQSVRVGPVPLEGRGRGMGASVRLDEASLPVPRPVRARGSRPSRRRRCRGPVAGGACRMPCSSRRRDRMGPPSRRRRRPRSPPSKTSAKTPCGLTTVPSLRPGRPQPPAPRSGNHPQGRRLGRFPHPSHQSSTGRRARTRPRVPGRSAATCAAPRKGAGSSSRWSGGTFLPAKTPGGHRARRAATRAPTS